ncbi:MAG: hypothetical protein V4671_31470, partial [Armatimonadota bacterium]
DDYLGMTPVPERAEGMEARLERLLTRDFALHQRRIEYWCLLDVEEEEEDPDDPQWVFVVTALMRRVWNACGGKASG